MKTREDILKEIEKLELYIVQIAYHEDWYNWSDTAVFSYMAQRQALMWVLGLTDIVYEEWIAF